MLNFIVAITITEIQANLWDQSLKNAELNQKVGTLNVPDQHFNFFDNRPLETDFQKKLKIFLEANKLRFHVICSKFL